MAEKENCRPAAQTGGSGLSLKRLLPLGLLLLGFALFFALGLDDYVTCAGLREHRGALLAFVADRRLLAPLTFMAIYVAVTALSLPGGALTTIIGAFLFGGLATTAMVVVAATLGATLLFVVAKSALGDPLRARAGPWMSKMAEGFQDNALNYLLVLRLIPLFPFFVVNLVPAFLGVRLGTYVLGTFVGIIPGTFLYASLGAGLGGILDTGEACDVEGVLTPQVVIALLGLAVLALLPVVYKKWKARRP
jgi:uncharacterized membrane protein YdjX (TVP38/TMEM64 family)